MFKEAEKHVTPISLEDSVKTDAVIRNLWSWSSSIESLGKFLFWAIIIIGVITAVTSSFYEVSSVYNYRTETKFDWGMFFLQLVDTALYAFIEYCVYHVVALLIGALASITQNTRATARILEYKETVGKDGVLGMNREPKENEWKCSKCGTINNNYVATCGCGNTKSDK